MSVGTKASAITNTADWEIVVTRVFDAPREVVWNAWTDPEQVVEWWGPKGFTTTIHEMDVRPGGVWRRTMHGPDGTDYANKSVFIEVVKPERIVYSHDGGKKGDPGAQFQATWTFEAQGDQTRLTLRMVFPSAAARQQVVKTYGAIEGGKQTLERLAGHLAKVDSSVTAPPERAFLISRVFNAPRELVFKAWTDATDLKHWWGPQGFTWVSGKIDLRPGGFFHYCMRSPDGHEMWGKFAYWEIAAPERLVFANSFSDQDGTTTRHPGSPSWPLEVLNTLTFTEHQGKTTVKLHAIPLNATEQERRSFEAGFASMQKGFTCTLDQLADYLVKF